MTSKIHIYEKIQGIIDEEINKSKGVILERCRSLFDELLGETVNNEMLLGGDGGRGDMGDGGINNITISLEDIQQSIENKEEGGDDGEDDGDGGDGGNDGDGEDNGSGGSDGVGSGDEEDDEVPVYEIEINSTTYYVSDEEPNFIFEKLQDEGVGDCVGIYYNDDPYFITYYNGERCYLNANEGSYFKYISPSVIGEEIQ